MELYTKRAFRCDCGGPRLVGRCRLAQGKEANTGNQYNQVTSGLQAPQSPTNPRL